jgi:hypothetical protein
MKALRYDNLVREIERIRPRRIMEIGTCKGQRAEMMIQAALVYGPVEYFGFDLFEAPPEEEFSARTHPWPIERVYDRLSGLGAKVSLFRGDTRQTLPGCGIGNIDMVFLDGGHSDDTVRSDFEAALICAEPTASLMLDDYWNYPGGGGCNALVDGLDREQFSVEILEPVDVFAKPYGELRTQMVRVVPL